MVMDVTSSSDMMLCIQDRPRGSVHSIRRGSTDVRSVGSDYLRRTSLAKLNALPLEAPITKVRNPNTLAPNFNSIPFCYPA